MKEKDLKVFSMKEEYLTLFVVIEVDLQVCSMKGKNLKNFFMKERDL